MITWNRLFFNRPNSYLMEAVISIHDLAMLLLSSILIFSLCAIRFNLICKYFNLNFREHHQLESAWTMLPFFLLLFILIPSLKSLYLLDTCLFCGLTLNVTGHQWYWNYFYTEAKRELEFDSYIYPDSENMRLLEVDNRILVPNEFPMRVLVTSTDVIHSWTVPSLGVKMDAVPGRIRQLCFITKRTGIFFGQCSEICGANHRFMPICLESISIKDFLKNFLLSSLYLRFLPFK